MFYQVSGGVLFGAMNMSMFVKLSIEIRPGFYLTNIGCLSCLYSAHKISPWWPIGSTVLAYVIMAHGSSLYNQSSCSWRFKHIIFHPDANINTKFFVLEKRNTWKSSSESQANTLWLQKELDRLLIYNYICLYIW